MNSEDFGALIRFNLAHEATEDQNLAIVSWLDFMMSSDPDGVFLLKGYAGTGKTSLVAAIVRTLQDMGMRTCLLAPTGRAAKVFSLYAGRTAYTIHKRIYRQRAITDMDTFQMNVNLHPDTLFIVDEASMISAAPSMGTLEVDACLRTCYSLSIPAMDADCFWWETPHSCLPLARKRALPLVVTCLRDMA